MKNNVFKFLALCAIVIFSSSLLLAAQHEGMLPPQLRVVQHFLGLTPDQVQEFVQLRHALEAEVRTRAAAVQQMERNLGELLKSESPAPGAVGAAVIEIHRLRREIGELHGGFVADFEALLTEEQTQKLRAVRHASRLEPILPAFRQLGLLPPPHQGPPPQGSRGPQELGEDFFGSSGQ